MVDEALLGPTQTHLEYVALTANWLHRCTFNKAHTLKCRPGLICTSYRVNSKELRLFFCMVFKPLYVKRVSPYSACVMLSRTKGVHSLTAVAPSCIGHLIDFKCRWAYTCETHMARLKSRLQPMCTERDSKFGLIAGTLQSICDLVMKG